MDDERAWLEAAMNTHDLNGLLEPTSLIDEFIDSLFNDDSDNRSHDVAQPAIAAKDLCMKDMPAKEAPEASGAESVRITKSLFGKGTLRAAAVNGDSDFVATTFKPVASIKPANVKKVCGTPTNKKMGLYCALELNHLGNCL